MATLPDEQLKQVMDYCYNTLKREMEEKSRTDIVFNTIFRRADENGYSDECADGYESRKEETRSLSSKMNIKDAMSDSVEEIGPEKKSFITKLSRVRRRYQEGFTMHALEHIIRGTWVERIFWTLKLCLAITLAIFMSWQLFEGYFHHHVDTKVNIETKTTLQLPMLFICGTQSKDYLAAFNDCQSNDSRSYDEKICTALRQTCPTFCLTSESHRLVNGTCEDISEDGNVKCAKELLGQCIAVNLDGQLYQTATQPAGAYTQQVHPDHLPLWLYIKTPGSVELIPRSWFQFSRVNRHGHYHVILEKTSIKRLPYPYSDPSCIVQGSKEALLRNIFIGNYTLDKCLTTCYTRAQLISCGATHATYRALLRQPNSLRHLFRNKNMSEIESCMVTRFEAMGDFYEKCRVKCVIPCVEDSYRVSVRHEPPTNVTSKELSIYFYYQEMKETIIENHPSLAISTLVANFGGQLGLMAGVSAISIIELVIWFVLFGVECIYRTFHTKK